MRTRGGPRRAPVRVNVGSSGPATAFARTRRRPQNRRTITRPPHTCRAIRLRTTHSLGNGISPRPVDCSRAWQGTHVPIQLSDAHKQQEPCLPERKGISSASERSCGVVGGVWAAFGGLRSLVAQASGSTGSVHRSVHFARCGGSRRTVAVTSSAEVTT